MKGRIVLSGVIGLGIGLGVWGVTNARSDAKLDPAKVADQIHAVVSSSRTIYSTHVVEKLKVKGLVAASEFWKTQDSVPLPAQFLIESGRLAAEKGTGLKYRLASLAPVYVWNAPSSEFERKGLEAVGKDPEKPYKGYVKIGRELTYQAIYADVAVSKSCVDCHNSHPKSSRHDYRLNDVMGAVIITIPLGEG